jgi:hypothetical protein
MEAHMSDLKSKQRGERLTPGPSPQPVIATPGLLVLGVLYPLVVVAIELIWQLCGQAFFDPMPTKWHVLAVCLVPISNLLTWLGLQKHPDHSSTALGPWLVFTNGVAIAISGFYALIFLPLAPLAIIGIIFYGIGLLPLAPLASFYVAMTLRRRDQSDPQVPSLRRHLMRGVAAGFVLLLALDVPAAATRLGVQWATSSSTADRDRGLSLLRTFGDDDLLLRLCYDAVGRPAGLLSAIVLFGGNGWLEPTQRQFTQSTAEMREIYYRVHGTPFNAKPAPFEKGKWARFADFQADNDHGGTEVGGRIKGLDLVSSRMDGSISGDDAVAYLEWVVEFRNTSLVDREARLQLALPPGGVVSRATLWVNGEEREAAYGGRAEVRAAYQRVAVQQRRDPLLVTTKGADRVLAQAFPVGGNGGTIKFKLGITAPLTVTDAGKASLTLPAIFDRNFSFAPDHKHNIWIESKTPLVTTTADIKSERVDARLFRLSGAIGDVDLARARPAITVERNPAVGPLVARIAGGEAVTQSITSAAQAAPTAMMLVVDGSRHMRASVASLITALDAIPANAKVGMIIATSPLQRVAVAPWGAEQQARLTTLLRSATFVGGQDNAPALAEALQLLEAEPKAGLLWLHGPQPVSFRGSAALLEQASTRLRRLPEVTLFSVEPGPNELLPDAPWAWSARSLPRTNMASRDLAAYFAGQLTSAPAFSATQTADGRTVDGHAKGSDHIARLWAHTQVQQLMRANPSTARPAALALAVQYRLVTPISGAVVLETKQQYDESRLSPVSQTSVPTVPEPHEWALAIIAMASLTWLVRRRRLAPAVA